MTTQQVPTQQLAHLAARPWEGEPASSMEKDLLKGYETEDWINDWQTLIDALDSWLRCDMEGSAIKHLNDGTLIERF